MQKMHQACKWRTAQKWKWQDPAKSMEIPFPCWWKQMLQESGGDVKESRNKDAFYRNATITVPPVAKEESVSNVFLILLSRQWKLIHQLWHSGVISDTNVLHVDWHLYQQWWKEISARMSGDGDELLWGWVGTGTNLRPLKLSLLVSCTSVLLWIIGICIANTL